jgi:hypothetical protein
MDHPKFKEMIQVSSRATNGVVVPDRDNNRKYIINLFKKNMIELRNRLLYKYNHWLPSRVTEPLEPSTFGQLSRSQRKSSTFPKNVSEILKQISVFCSIFGKKWLKF